MFSKLRSAFCTRFFDRNSEETIVFHDYLNKWGGDLSSCQRVFMDYLNPKKKISTAQLRSHLKEDSTVLISVIWRRSICDHDGGAPTAGRTCSIQRDFSKKIWIIWHPFANNCWCFFKVICKPYPQNNWIVVLTAGWISVLRGSYILSYI